MKAGKELGLKINKGKTKYMVSCKSGDAFNVIEIKENTFICFMEIQIFRIYDDQKKQN